MKIRKVNENSDPFNTDNDNDDNISISIEFSGKKQVTLNDIKDTDYYVENYKDDMTATELKDLIFYMKGQRKPTNL